MELLGDDVWISAKDLKWWPAYDGQADVILDDFRGHHCSFTELLRILDRYPLQVPYKGGFTPFLARRIIITSAHHPRKVYRRKRTNNNWTDPVDWRGPTGGGGVERRAGTDDEEREDIAQLLRRIDRVIEFRVRRGQPAAIPVDEVAEEITNWVMPNGYEDAPTEEIGEMPAADEAAPVAGT